MIVSYIGLCSARAARSGVVRLLDPGNEGRPSRAQACWEKMFSNSPSSLWRIVGTSFWLCKQTEKFLIIAQTPQLHIQRCLNCRNGLCCLSKDAEVWLNTLFSSQLRQCCSIWGVLRVTRSSNGQCTTSLVLPDRASLPPAGFRSCAFDSAKVSNATPEPSTHEAEHGGLSKRAKLWKAACFHHLLEEVSKLWGSCLLLAQQLIKR